MRRDENSGTSSGIGLRYKGQDARLRRGGLAHVSELGIDVACVHGSLFVVRSACLKHWHARDVTRPTGGT